MIYQYVCLYMNDFGDLIAGDPKMKTKTAEKEQYGTCKKISIVLVGFENHEDLANVRAETVETTEAAAKKNGLYFS